MNRLICTNLDAATPASKQALPSVRESGKRSEGPARILFINGAELGFATTSRNLQHYTSLRNDIQAVHFSVVMPKWLRLMCAGFPIKPVRIAGFDLHGERQMLAHRLLLTSFLNGPLGVPQNRYDVVHIMTQQRGWMVPAMSRQTSARFVVNSDATAIAWDRDFEVPRITPRIHAGMERRIYAACTAVACASDWVAQSMINDYGVPPHKIIMHMPCARRTPGVAPRTPDAHVHRPADAPIKLVFVGNDWPRKGGPRLLRWHQERWAAPTKGRRAELHICSGAAPQDHSAKGVIWHGATPHDKLIREILPNCDIFVMPTHEDTFLIAAQEAQTMGLPVVSTRLAGIPEVVMHDRTGFLCQREDEAGYIAAIERLMNEPELLTQFSAAAAAHAMRDLSADTWHNHLLDQLVAVADGREVVFKPRVHSSGVTT